MASAVYGVAPPTRRSTLPARLVYGLRGHRRVVDGFLAVLEVLRQLLHGAGELTDGVAPRREHDEGDDDEDDPLHGEGLERDGGAGTVLQHRLRLRIGARESPSHRHEEVQVEPAGDRSE